MPNAPLRCAGATPQNNETPNRLMRPRHLEQRVRHGAKMTTAFNCGLKDYYIGAAEIYHNPYKTKKRRAEWRSGWLYAYKSSTGKDYAA